jgi:hypothetical protein
MPESLQEIVEARRNLQAKLKAIGVSSEHFEEVMDLLNAYQEGNLENARNEQFHETAFSFCGKINAAAGKNVDKTSVFLRQFARYVVQNVLHPDPEKLDEIVDTIPPMDLE